MWPLKTSRGLALALFVSLDLNPVLLFFDGLGLAVQVLGLGLAGVAHCRAVRMAS